jgi:hypothetical protein
MCLLSLNDSSFSDVLDGIYDSRFSIDTAVLYRSSETSRGCLAKRRSLSDY